MVRLEPDQFDALDRWCSKQEPPPSRPEAIRRLVELGLTVKPRSSRTHGRHDERASELAGQVIDGLAQEGANVEQKASRKRRLLKGPEEFHDVRVDRPRKKK
ncbi:MAG: hypothetical protein KGL35_02705 [Bradyrhizobium sp.]|uniref:hypothetical protein n=1 Tax=Bradyrhizobium sp. TaxID=376 RepID=UPI001C28E79E|nr:hypothetical protein [Bradyrhizobium sp.]MBU6461341.1 hypothetical protein [Pseudomonadota bacterium]MDE2066516.1 hypothetical protein [Bradyrhizobium sp.]MDE2467665.1 hypothetical protein [Bradyrhizobium sp.]